MKLKVFGLVLLILLVSAVGVYAALTGPVDQDCFVTGTTCNNIQVVNVIGNSVAQPTCLAPVAVGVFSKDMSPAGTTDIGYAELTLQITALSGSNAYPMKIGLFESNVELNDDGNPPPVNITTIAGNTLNSQITISGGATTGPVTFPTSPEFVAYANAARGGRLTIVAKQTECAGFSSVSFGSVEGGNAGEFAFRDSPTAVAVDTFSANNGISPVVWVGLLLVVVLGLGAFVTMRRRDSAAG